MESHTIRLRFVRHGNIPEHLGDVPLTVEGVAHASSVGQRIAAELPDGTELTVLHDPTLRTRETASNLVFAMRAACAGSNRTVSLPQEHLALRNPDFYVAGTRVELGTTAQVVADQLGPDGPTAAEIDTLPFYRERFAAGDHEAFWLDHAAPPGESSLAVARRLLTFASSLRAARRQRPLQYLCVTHSEVMRAFLFHYLHGDFGQPDFLESICLNLRPDYTTAVRFRDQEATIFDG